MRFVICSVFGLRRASSRTRQTRQLFCGEPANFPQSGEKLPTVDEIDGAFEEAAGIIPEGVPPLSHGPKSICPSGAPEIQKAAPGFISQAQHARIDSKQVRHGKTQSDGQFPVEFVMGAAAVKSLAGWTPK